MRRPATGFRTVCLLLALLIPASATPKKVWHRVFLRLTQGVQVIPADDGDPAYYLDLVGSHRFVDRDLGDTETHKGLMWLPELGYHYDHRGDGSHFGSLGLGVGWSAGPMFAASLVPRAVLGSVTDDFAAGVRATALLDFAYGIFSLELSHQTLWIGGDPRHDFRAGIGLDLVAVGAMVIFGIVMAGARPR